jgi:hypothetical protein
MYLQIKGLLPLRRLAGEENSARYQKATDDVAESPRLHLNPRLERPRARGLVVRACFQLRQDSVQDGMVAIGRDSQSAGTNVRSLELR